MRSLVALLATGLLLIVCCSCSTSGAVVGHATSARPTIGQVTLEDRTLGAATVAAQENLDRFTAGDFAGVWELMAKTVRDGISQDDFVAFYKTCKKADSSISVTGFRMEGDDEAIVRMNVGDVEYFRVMLYESGRWVMKPTDDFAGHLGQPVTQIVAEERADGRCAG
ncbi:MAG: hypothetical protein ABW137_06520 [Mycobacterium sp.]